MTKKKKATKKTTTKAGENEWDDIAQNAIMAAERVHCPLEDFAKGLREIEQTIHERRLLAEDEVTHNEEVAVDDDDKGD